MVFDALLQRQQGKCAICEVSQEELKKKVQESAIRWAKDHEKAPAYAQWTEEDRIIWALSRFAVHATLHIDHCHKTGMIRGLLCPHCNQFLGLLEKYDLLHNYLEPAFLYTPLNSKQRMLVDDFQWVLDGDWFTRNLDRLLLYMQQDRWLPRKDILFHLQGDPLCKM